MAKIGLKNLHYAKMLTDKDGTATYDTVVAVPGIIHISVTPNGKLTTLYADNAPAEAAGALGDIAVEAELNEIPLEMLATALGHAVDKGVMTKSADDKAPYLAIMGEANFVKDGNEYTEYFKLYKTKFNEPTVDYETKKENVNFQTGKLSGTACVRTDGKWAQIAKSNATDYADVSATWYTTV